MPHDHDLEQRIRERLADEPDVTEQRMFGGLAFLVGGHMAVAASGQGGMMVRVDPAQSEQLLDRAGVERMVMRDRPLRGWLRVDVGVLRTKRQLGPWVDRGVSYVRTLPPKTGRSKRS